MPILSSSRLALCVAASILASGCMRSNPTDLNAIASPAALSQDQWREQADKWGKRFDEAPGDRTASINYARALRAIGQRAQAVAVLEQTAARLPNDLEVLGAYGRALADAGKLREALSILEKSHVPERPDWRTLSAQGVVADKLGDQEAAQGYYRSALNIAPNEPSILSNLGFSYALSRKLKEAESTLRQAAENPKADSRVRQNLVLVLGLEGRFDEAETLAREDLSAEEASQNVAFLRKLVSQSNNWSKIKQNLQR